MKKLSIIIGLVIVPVLFITQSNFGQDTKSNLNKSGNTFLRKHTVVE
ncbi:MAG TPA: hypothetical protein VLB50_05435 [Ignavibacteriaceae bacterium]|nr:hypothetical protein [Ignavibacteriaceae bacterium]